MVFFTRDALKEVLHQYGVCWIESGAASKVTESFPDEKSELSSVLLFSARSDLFCTF